MLGEVPNTICNFLSMEGAYPCPQQQHRNTWTLNPKSIICTQPGVYMYITTSMYVHSRGIYMYTAEYIYTQPRGMYVHNRGYFFTRINLPSRDDLWFSRIYFRLCAKTNPVVYTSIPGCLHIYPRLCSYIPAAVYIYTSWLCTYTPGGVYYIPWRSFSKNFKS